MIVTVKMCDVRTAKMCAKGARQFFGLHGLDWSSFLKNGISSDKLENTGDAMAMKCVEVARGRQ